MYIFLYSERCSELCGSNSAAVWQVHLGLEYYFGFYLHRSLRGCFGSGRNLVFKAGDQWKGMFEWEIWCIRVCVCTQLCYSASVVRSDANKSNSWNLKWQNISSFHSVMFVLGYSAAFHSRVLKWFFTTRQEGGNRLVHRRPATRAT